MFAEEWVSAYQGLGLIWGWFKVYCSSMQGWIEIYIIRVGLGLIDSQISRVALGFYNLLRN